VSLEIRKLTQRDAALWWNLRLEMLEREPQAFSSSAEDHRKTTVEMAAARIGFPSQENFVMGAFEDGSLVGVAGFYREQERKSRHKGHVWGVYVKATRRGSGVGRSLMHRMIEEAKHEAGLEQIMLTVTSEQVAARRLYESLGFRIFGREPRALLIDGRYVDEEYMILPLLAQD